MAPSVAQVSAFLRQLAAMAKSGQITTAQKEHIKDLFAGNDAALIAAVERASPPQMGSMSDMAKIIVDAVRGQAAPAATLGSAPAQARDANADGRHSWLGSLLHEIYVAHQRGAFDRHHYEEFKQTLLQRPAQHVVEQIRATVRARVASTAPASTPVRSAVPDRPAGMPMPSPAVPMDEERDWRSLANVLFDAFCDGSIAGEEKARLKLMLGAEDPDLLHAYRASPAKDGPSVLAVARRVAGERQMTPARMTPASERRVATIVPGPDSDAARRSLFTEPATSASESASVVPTVAPRAPMGLTHEHVRNFLEALRNLRVSGAINQVRASELKQALLEYHPAVCAVAARVPFQPNDVTGLAMSSMVFTSATGALPTAAAVPSAGPSGLITGGLPPAVLPASAQRHSSLGQVLVALKVLRGMGRLDAGALAALTQGVLEQRGASRAAVAWQQCGGAIEGFASFLGGATGSTATAAPPETRPIVAPIPFSRELVRMFHLSVRRLHTDGALSQQQAHALKDLMLVGDGMLHGVVEQMAQRESSNQPVPPALRAELLRCLLPTAGGTATTTAPGGDWCPASTPAPGSAPGRGPSMRSAAVDLAAPSALRRAVAAVLTSVTRLTRAGHVTAEQAGAFKDQLLGSTAAATGAAGMSDDALVALIRGGATPSAPQQHSAVPIADSAAWIPPPEVRGGGGAVYGPSSRHTAVKLAAPTQQRQNLASVLGALTRIARGGVISKQHVGAFKDQLLGDPQLVARAAMMNDAALAATIARGPPFDQPLFGAPTATPAAAPARAPPAASSAAAYNPMFAPERMRVNSRHSPMGQALHALYQLRAHGHMPAPQVNATVARLLKGGTGEARAFVTSMFESGMFEKD